MFHTIVFDIGGVLAFDVWEHMLLDDHHGIAHRWNLDTAEVFEFGRQLWEEFAYTSADENNSRESLEKDYWNRFIQRFDLSQSADAFIEMTDRFIRPVEGMTPLLEKLQHEGLNLVICSNNNEFWLKRQLEKLGLHRFFESSKVISSSRIGFPKISTNFEMFKSVMDVTNESRSSYLFIDDRFENIQRAVEFGWTAILFPQESPEGAMYLETLFEAMGILNGVRKS